MKVILTMLAVGFSVFSVKAQNNNNNNNNNKSNAIAVSLGVAANYYYGPGDRNFDKFENDRVNWQLNGLLGLTLARDKNDHRTMIAGFGSFGINNANTVKHIFADQNYLTAALDQSSANNFYQLEGGLLIAEVLRLSTGVGRQVFNEQPIVSTDGIELQATSLEYNSSTIGFNFNVSSVAVVVNCSFNYGRDYTKTVIVPSAGLMLRF